MTIGQYGRDLILPASPVVIRSGSNDTREAEIDASGNLQVAGTVVVSSVTGNVTTRDAGVSATVTRVVIDGGMSGGRDLTPVPTTGQKIVLVDMTISSDTALAVSLLQANGDLIDKFYMAANTTIVLSRVYIKAPTANQKVMVKTSAAGNVCVWAAYYSEA